MPTVYERERERDFPENEWLKVELRYPMSYKRITAPFLCLGGWVGAVVALQPWIKVEYCCWVTTLSDRIISQSNFHALLTELTP